MKTKRILIRIGKVGFIMKKNIEENKISTKALGIPLSEFTTSTRFFLKEIKENFAYEDGKRTNEFRSTTLTCVDVETFSTLKIKVETKFRLTQKDLDEATERIFVEIPTNETIVTPYKIEYGKATVTITAPTATISLVESEDDLL